MSVYSAPGNSRSTAVLPTANRLSDEVTPLAEALRMLDAFASVGARTLDLTHINIDGEKRGFRPAQTLGQLKNSMPHLPESAPKRQNNIIVRPYGTTAQLIQLDDLDAEALQHVHPAAFLTLKRAPAIIRLGSPSRLRQPTLRGDSGKEATPTRAPPEPPASPARSTTSASTSRTSPW